MPSIRKRIGYLPSLNIKSIITKIAKEEKLSQSKVVGILVEEALKARGIFDLHENNNLMSKRLHSKGFSMHNSSIKHNDLDELISDKGITYNKKESNQKTDNFLYESKELYNEDLFEQFKDFILFQKMIKEK